MLRFSTIDPERMPLVMALPGNAVRGERRVAIDDLYDEELQVDPEKPIETLADIHDLERPDEVYRIRVDFKQSRVHAATELPADLQADLDTIVKNGARYVLYERLQEVWVWKALQVEHPKTPPSPYMLGIDGLLSTPAPPFAMFPFKGVDWVAYDAFCLQRDCPCLECQITLVPSNLRKATEKDSFRIYYTLTNDRARRSDDGKALRRPEAEALAALSATYGDLKQVMGSRRRLLRALALKRFDFDQPREDPLPEPSVRATLVGRNDPCPCGSVKKYKRCCG